MSEEGRLRTLVARGPWIAAFALANFLCFPQQLFGLHFDVGFVFAWLAPALFVLAVRSLEPRRAAWVGFVATWFAHGCVLYWSYVAVVHYGHAPVALGLVAPFGMALYPGLFGALLGMGVARFERAAGRAESALGRIGFALAIGAAWVVFDHLRSFAGGGFPWVTLGYAHHTNGWMLGLASWTGVYGLGFANVLASLGLLALPPVAAAVGRSGGEGAAPLRGAEISGVAFALVVFALLLGALSRPGPPESGTTTQVRIAAIQGNIDQGQKWDTDAMDATLDAYAALTEEAAAAGAEIVAWPETAFPGILEFDFRRRERVLRLARDTGVVLVVGAVGVEPDASGRRVRAVFDSAFVIDGEGRILERYDKTHLVPFGEYIPLRSLIGRFVKALATGATSSDVTPGERVRAFDLELPARGAEPGRSIRVAVPICYELLFPDLMRRFAGDGAQVLLGITNDAWYGRTGAPHQFLAMTAMRAAESQVPLVRAANTGISAFVGDGGTVRREGWGGSPDDPHGPTEIFERTWIIADVPLRDPGSPGTFYVRNGDAFAWLCWLGTAAGVLGSGKRAGRSLGGSERRPEDEREA